MNSNLLNLLMPENLTKEYITAIRTNGVSLISEPDDFVKISKRKDVSGLNIVVEEGTKNKHIHMPVIVDIDGIEDKVVNEFHIKDNSDVEIVAGCGVHSDAAGSSHFGKHIFYIGKNCHVKYYEKHIGQGTSEKKIINPETKIFIDENSIFEMETHQISGVSFSKRDTFAEIKGNSKFIVSEKILTTEKEIAISNFEINLIGNNSKTEILSRVVAQGSSRQEFTSKVVGDSLCFGHIECDGILSDKAVIISVPSIVAQNVNANLIHEAAIGKISEEQQYKLMTLGLTKEQAEKTIIDGFLK